MVYYNIYNQNLDCIKTSYSELSEFNKIYSNFSQRDSRIIKLDFDGDIAQIIIKTNQVHNPIDLHCYPGTLILILINLVWKERVLNNC